MGIQYTRSGGKPVGGQPYRQMAREMQGIYAEEMEVAGDQSRSELMSYFRSRGTNRAWSGSFPGAGGRRSGSNPGGRIDSGDMRDDLEVRITRGVGIGLDVGWINNFQDYYAIQDSGFSEGGFRPAQEVEGMGLMAHMRFYVRDKVDEALDRAGKRVVDGL